MIKKYINILFMLALLLVGSGCADDFSWGGTSVGSDEYLIAFTIADPQIEYLYGTRAADATRDEIKSLSLVIFDNNSQLVKSPVHFTNSNLNDRWSMPTADATGTVTVMKSEVGSGKWYLIANAKDQVAAVATSGISETDFLAGMKKSSSGYNDTQLYHKDQLDGESNHIFVNHQDITIGEETQTTAKVFELQRIYARVSVEVAKSGLNFRMEKAGLSRYIADGSVGLEMSDGSAASSSTFNSTADASESNITWVAPEKGTYARVGERLTSASYPYKVDNLATEGKQKMMMIVKGKYISGESQVDTYYAIPVPNLMGNRHKILQISGVESAGEPTPEAAERNPGGLAVVFKDDSEQIHSIITDGENVLAVVDTIRLSANTADGGKLSESVTFRARVKGSGAPKLSITAKDAEEDGTWITDGFPATTTGIQVGAGDENGLYTHKFVYTISAGQNLGSERSKAYIVKLQDSNGNDIAKMEREVVILQEAPSSIDYSAVMDIKLSISGSYSLTNQDYFAFVNPALKHSTSDPVVKGILPEENGGRIRNIGLHAPMPNGGVTYTYTITPKGGATIDGSPSAVTKTYGDSANGYNYIVESDKIKVKKDGITYTLDLYHTGFFHNDNGIWYYYEVMRQDERELYWLDRNLGATSAGMGVRSESGWMEGNWPIVGDASGGGYYGNNPTCPAGWKVPTYAQLRSLTTSTNFNITRRNNSGDRAVYFCPAFKYSGTQDGKKISISSYFPQAMMNEGNGGDPASGYYLSTTSSGSTGWYQLMQFVGLNSTSQNINMTQYSVSVRCCAGNYNPSTQGTKYSCNVKGYTHVFLYYEASDGSKTYLTSWPGEEIAVKGDVSRYHRFELESPVNYGSGLKVIFNYVKDGKVTDSNVYDDDRNARNGIEFKNGGKYDKNAQSVASGAKEGDWVTEDTPVYNKETFRLKGNFNGKSWNNGAMEDYTFNNNDDGTYTISVQITNGGEFVICQNVENSWKEWKHNESTIAVQNGETYTMYEGQGNDQNWKFDKTGKYTLTIDWASQSFSVSYEEPVVVTYKYFYYGNLSSDVDQEREFTETSGYKITDYEVTKDNGSFLIRRKRYENEVYKDYEDLKFNSSSPSLGTDVSFNKSYSNRWSLGKGTYTFELNPTNNTIKVTKKVVVTYKYFYYGNLFNSDEEKEFTEDLGYKFTDYKVNKDDGSFLIRRKRYENEVYKDQEDLKFNSSSPSLDTDVPFRTSYSNRWSLGKGTYTFELNPTNETIKVTKKQESQFAENSVFFVKGDFTKEWVNLYVMTKNENSGVWSCDIYTNNSNTIKFGIVRSEGNSYNQKDWIYHKNGGSSTDAIVANNDNGSNFELNGAGKYHIEFNPVTMQVTTTKSSLSNYKTYRFRWYKDDSNNGNFRDAIEWNIGGVSGKIIALGDYEGRYYVDIYAPAYTDSSTITLYRYSNNDHKYTKNIKDISNIEEPNWVNYLIQIY